MKFDSDKAYTQILTKGVVATLREFEYGIGQKVLLKRGKFGFGWGVVREVFRIENSNLDELQKHVENSGFVTTREWIDEAKYLHGKIPSYLVVVERLS